MLFSIATTKVLAESPPRTIRDYEKLAEASVPEAYWSYLSCGAGEGLTKKNNVVAYDR